MASTCAVSKGLALSNILRNLLRAELATDLPVRPSSLSTPGNRFLSSKRYSETRNLYHRRYFASSTIFYNSSIQSSIPETSDETEPKKQEGASANATQNDSAQVAEPAVGEPTSTRLNQASKAGKGARRNNRKFEKIEDVDEDSAVKDMPPGINKKKKEPWQIHKDAMKRKFKEGWNPPKKLSPDAIEGIRHLHATAPDKFTTPVLAEEFKVSPEAIRRILKSKWRPSEKEMEDRRKRWGRRHDRIWSQMAELGLRPKRKSAEEVSDVRILHDDDDKSV